jgi:hypothetical protein
MLEPDEQEYLKKGIVEGALRFRFEGADPVTFETRMWLEIDADAVGQTWQMAVRMGDGASWRRTLHGPFRDSAVAEAVEALVSTFRRLGKNIPKA